MATYTNDLRLKEIATGDEDGTWGTSTNTNLSLIADAFSLGTKQLAADADETFTMPDATADGTRSLYLKLTSAVSLSATRTVTLAPNTVSKVWIIENATTGSQIITIAQGSGATVNVPNGSKLMVVTDGAGAGAAVFNANPTTTSGTVTSVGGTGTVNGITLTGTVTSSGNLTLGGTLANVSLTTQVTGTLPVANGGTGITSLGAGVATFLGTPSSANLASAVTDETGSGALVFATSPTLVTPALGTPASGVLTNATGLPLTTGVTGVLPLANGGTGAALVDPNADRIMFWDDSAGSTAYLTAGSGLSISGTTLTATGSGGTVTSVSGTGTVNGITLTGTVTSSGDLTLGGTLSNVSLTTQVTGTLPAANGGTGITSLGTGVATWLGTPSSANLASAVTDETGSGALVFGTAPTLSGPTFNDGYTEEVYAIPSSTTPALSPTNGSIQTWTLTGNSTPTAGTWAAGQSLTLMIDDGTAYTVDWSSVAVTWVGGSAPALATSGYTVIEFWKVVSTIYGALVGNVA